MIEKLFNSRKLDETRVRRAFRWVVTFRDFPKDAWQTVDSEGMIKDALTLFTKGRAEFYLNGERRADRVPGILSSEHDVFEPGGTFKIVYVKPTTRVCIPRLINRGKLPTVEKIVLKDCEPWSTRPGGKYMVCLGWVFVGGKGFKAETTFTTEESKQCFIVGDTILLEFKDEASR